MSIALPLAVAAMALAFARKGHAAAPAKHPPKHAKHDGRGESNVMKRAVKAAQLAKRDVQPTRRTPVRPRGSSSSSPPSSSSSSPSPSSSKPAPATSTPRTNVRELKKAFVRIRVLSAQKLLRALGYRLTLDGLYGPKSSAAWVEAAKRVKQSPVFRRVDGTHVIVSRETAKALYRAQQGKGSSPAAKPASSSPVPPPAPPAPPAPSNRPPNGYDATKAANAAPDIAKMLRKRGRDHYNHKALAAWQVRAGLKPDGIYGRGTHAALRHFAGALAPPAFFAQGTDSYPWA